MNRESQLLVHLQGHAGYKILEDLWRIRFAEIQEKRDKAAQRGSETAWRYWAGIEKGFREAVVTLEAELASMENEVDREQSDERFSAIAEELKGETVS